MERPVDESIGCWPASVVGLAAAPYDSSVPATAEAAARRLGNLVGRHHRDLPVRAARRPFPGPEPLRIPGGNTVRGSTIRGDRRSTGPATLCAAIADPPERDGGADVAAGNRFADPCIIDISGYSRRFQLRMARRPGDELLFQTLDCGHLKAVFDFRRNLPERLFRSPARTIPRAFADPRLASSQETLRSFVTATAIISCD